MMFGHAPIVDVLATAHGIRKMHAPIIAIVDIREGGGNAAFGHDRVGLAEQRLAHDGHLRTGGGGLDRGAQTGAAGPDHEHVGGQGFEGLAQKITLGS